MAHRCYYYVDESGQETVGRFFVTSVAVTNLNLEAALLDIEKESKKRNIKYRKSDYRYRRDYIDRLAKLAGFFAYYKEFENRKDYQVMTATATAAAIRQNGGNVAMVYVDGLRRNEYHKFKSFMKPTKGVYIHGVRKDENNPYIRVADALCGLIHDAKDGNEWSVSAVARLKKRGILKQL